jgi:steroid 5-alpha reductase family enzyme
MALLYAFTGVMSMMIALWLISIPLKNVSIVDIFWGIGFIVANGIYLCLDDEWQIRDTIVFILVLIWGLRLSIYLLIRNYGKPEDYRYQEFRRVYGEQRYWWLSFFQVFLLQGALITIISLPLLGISTYSDSESLNIIDYLAIIVWIIGFLFETLGDYQLAKFKSNPLNKGKVLDKGLWRYTRHPNYFGDAAIWWSYGLFSIAAEAYWQVIGSLIMTYLIIRISGVSLLERSLTEQKPEYKDYIERTSSFFPWLPKRKIN